MKHISQIKTSNSNQKLFQCIYQKYTNLDLKKLKLKCTGKAIRKGL